MAPMYPLPADMVCSAVQDAHEFLCAVLEQLQAEVVRREVAAAASRRVALSATACPAARNFGFCIEHQVRAICTCGACGAERAASRNRPIWSLKWIAGLVSFRKTTVGQASCWVLIRCMASAGGVQPVWPGDAAAGAVHAPQPGAAARGGRGGPPAHAEAAAGPPAGAICYDAVPAEMFSRTAKGCSQTCMAPTSVMVATFVALTSRRIEHSEAFRACRPFNALTSCKSAISPGRGGGEVVRGLRRGECATRRAPRAAPPAARAGPALQALQGEQTVRLTAQTTTGVRHIQWQVHMLCRLPPMLALHFRRFLVSLQCLYRPTSCWQTGKVQYIIANSRDPPPAVCAGSALPRSLGRASRPASVKLSKQPSGRILCSARCI